MMRITKARLRKLVREAVREATTVVDVDAVLNDYYNMSTETFGEDRPVWADPVEFLNRHREHANEVTGEALIALIDDTRDDRDSWLARVASRDLRNITFDGDDGPTSIPAVRVATLARECLRRRSPSWP